MHTVFPGIPLEGSDKIDIYALREVHGVVCVGLLADFRVAHGFAARVARSGERGAPPARPVDAYSSRPCSLVV